VRDERERRDKRDAKVRCRKFEVFRISNPELRVAPVARLSLVSRGYLLEEERYADKEKG
jgi:hypothetical protein